jgi:phosphatidylinositol alpha-1,6-mannosyltransferase
MKNSMTNPSIKVALVTLDYPPERGGVARYLGNLVAGSEGLIDVFVNQGHPSEGPGHVKHVRLLARGPFSWRPMIGFMRRLGKAGYSQLLISHLLPVGTAAWIANKLGGLPYSIIVHGLDLRLAQSNSRKTWLARQILRGATNVIANSRAIAAEINAFEPTIYPKVVTPGAEPFTLPTRSDARRVIGLPENAFVLLAVSRHVQRKGLDRLVETMGFLPKEISLVIIGDGPDRGRIETLSWRFRDRVRLLTAATDLERNLWYAAADVFILPVREEPADVEGFGIVFLEAALAGLPVIAGKSGGTPEAIVDGVTGLLVDPHNPREIAEAVKALYDRPDIGRQFGDAGKLRAERDFRWEDRAQRFRQILEGTR